MIVKKQYIKKLYENNKRLISNFSNLSILNFFNLIIPLATYPYLIRVLDANLYGILIFVQAIIAYFNVLVSFGFNISSTNQISINRDNKNKLSEIVSSTIIIKSIFLILSFLILVVIIDYLPNSKGNELLFYLTFWICIYEVIFPVWYFQGIEKMGFITSLILTARVFFLVLIFVFIKNEDDYLLVPIINGFGALFTGFVSLYIIVVKHKVAIRWQPFYKLIFYTKESVSIFFSNLSSKIYITSNKVIVGSFLGLSEVAYYDLAEKVVNIAKLPQIILNQSIFPKISKEKNTSFVKKIFLISVSANLIVMLLVMLLSNWVVKIIGGLDLMSASDILIMLSVTVPIIAMSNIFGIQLLIPFGHKSIFTKIIVSSGIIYLLFCLILYLSVGFNVYNIVIVTILTEVFVTTTMFYYVKELRLWK